MPLDKLLELLFREPLLLILLLGWIVGGLGKLMQQKKKGPAAAPRSKARPARAPARSPEEIAAEMRRLLGMEPAPRQKPAAAPPQVPAARPPAREAFAERPPEPLRPATLGRVEVHVDPHVGERMQQRRAPSSGGVARRELGTLGGRNVGARQLGPARKSLVDLSDLKRAVVLREILDAPRALRDWDN
jgi:hypothetical protein